MSTYSDQITHVKATAWNVTEQASLRRSIDDMSSFSHYKRKCWCTHYTIRHSEKISRGESYFFEWFDLCLHHKWELAELTVFHIWALDPALEAALVDVLEWSWAATWCDKGCLTISLAMTYPKEEKCIYWILVIQIWIAEYLQMSCEVIEPFFDVDPAKSGTLGFSSWDESLICWRLSSLVPTFTGDASKSTSNGETLSLGDMTLSRVILIL